MLHLPGSLAATAVTANPPMSALGRKPDLGTSALASPAVRVAVASPLPKLGVCEVVSEPVEARVQAPLMGPTPDASDDAAFRRRQKRKAHSPAPGSRPRSRRSREHDRSRDSDSESSDYSYRLSRRRLGRSRRRYRRQMRGTAVVVITVTGVIVVGKSLERVHRRLNLSRNAGGPVLLGRWLLYPCL